MSEVAMLQAIGGMNDQEKTVDISNTVLEGSLFPIHLRDRHPNAFEEYLRAKQRLNIVETAFKNFEQASEVVRQKEMEFISAMESLDAASKAPISMTPTHTTEENHAMENHENNSQTALRPDLQQSPPPATHYNPFTDPRLSLGRPQSFHPQSTLERQSGQPILHDVLNGPKPIPAAAEVGDQLVPRVTGGSPRHESMLQTRGKQSPLGQHVVVAQAAEPETKQNHSPWPWSKRRRASSMPRNKD
ncbi:hypothetical protein M427DRAFT_324989 [Gonapodya prolifera JEL478]|uniref:Uncharacterized protein n=1 Tax=Gonapodya prolifera (strain JEL478) TaxID=1344416 RepID=A0A139AF31_GONPJ|nr:hypothetical protein M427DRAFT_324989 [Gonapodya prolifera JEL478]|eukprot:KXS15421.1 hypothetical protein M427DRAFT_324989 [Gonapodya prolifera JEL478]